MEFKRTKRERLPRKVKKAILKKMRTVMIYNCSHFCCTKHK